MFFINPQDYLKRITYALENVVAPEIESDHARGQVLAAVFLLDQLTDRIGYKPELILQDITLSVKTTNQVVEACRKNDVTVPADILEPLADLQKTGCEANLETLARAEKMLCTAIDLFFTCQDILGPDPTHELSGVIIEHLQNIGLRDLGLMKISTATKLIQPKK